MKYVLILIGGMADEPVDEFDGRTPLEAAHTPAADRMALEGKSGRVNTIPEGMPLSEEVALLAIAGYDPAKFFTGEAGLAAAGLGVQLGGEAIALRHALVTEADGKLADHAAGQVTLPEAEALLGTLNGSLARADVRFYLGRGFTGVTVVPNFGPTTPLCRPPESVIEMPVEKCLPTGEGSELLRRIIGVSRQVFREHDINRVRTDLGENPANLLWLWGAGRPTTLPAFAVRHGLRAAMIAGLESARGLANLAGMTLPPPLHDAGTYRTDLSAKATTAIDLLATHDVVFVHVAAPADAGIEGNPRRKRQIIEDIDAVLVSPLLEHVCALGEARLMLLPTHTVSSKRRCRTAAEVPLAMIGCGLEPVREAPFGESAMAQAEIAVRHGHELLEYFLTR